MRLAQQLHDDLQIVRVLERRLDASFAEDFIRAVSDLIAGGPHLVILDLSRVDFIDSRGLGSVLALYKMTAEEGDLVISGARDTILTLFRLARIDNIIAVYATEREAMAALRPAAAVVGT